MDFKSLSMNLFLCQLQHLLFSFFPVTFLAQLLKACNLTSVRGRTTSYLCPKHQRLCYDGFFSFKGFVPWWTKINTANVLEWEKNVQNFLAFSFWFQDHACCVNDSPYEPQQWGGRLRLKQPAAKNILDPVTVNYPTDILFWAYGKK